MSNNRPIHKQLEAIQRIQERLSVKQLALAQKGFESTNPSDIIKANAVWNVTERQETNRKSYLIDPYEFQNFLGFKDRAFQLSYNMLKRISYSVPIVRAIIMTRIDQVAAFCEPQPDKYSTGFVVRRKQSYFHPDENDQELTKDDKYKIQKITEFILNCGINNEFEADDFDTFVRKIINDSLTYDQMCFEVVHDKRGRPIEFYAVDASTIRIADTIDTEKADTRNQRDDFRHRDKVMGYYPSHCQIRDNAIVTDFYPWEMCFGVRNPTTNIYSNDYGISEIEILTQIITSMLWSDEYNRRFFSQGSAPKGFFKVKPGTSISEQKMTQFKQHWQAMMSNVYNSHKTPILEGDIDWIDLQKNNRDMEFAKWQEYLIKLACAIYRIDPAEINFPLGGGSERAMFEGNNEARLKHSKDKGLYPLLRFLQRKLNKYIISRIDPNFELVFVGLEAESAKEELESDIKMMSNFMTVDEIRIKRGLKPLGEKNGGNAIANSIVFQAVNSAKQQEMQEEQQQQMQQQGGLVDQYGQPVQPGEEDNQQMEGEDDDNPFEKAFDIFAKTLND